ncbi:SIR2 family protein [Chloroflexota bacterium]
MKPSGDLTDLARQMLERRRQEFAKPFILFLGQACASAAGVPSNLDIAHLLFSNPDLAAQYLDEIDDPNDDQLMEAYTEFIREMTAGQRYRMLLSFYDSVPVPAFYQDLALLIKAGFFEHILTTNIDTLLEQALNSVGMWQGKDYHVLSLGRSEELPGRSRSTSSETPLVVIKLHGDLAQQQVAITPDEISDALEPQRAFVKGEISGDMVMVGYNFESEPLISWLSYVPGELWWVNQEPPDDDRMENIEESRTMRYISGEPARPQAFFTQLTYLLFQPQSSQAQYSFEEPAWIPAASKGLEDELILSGDLQEIEYSDIEFLQTQLQRGRAVLRNLEQTVVPGERSVQVQSQIEYQRGQVTQLEDQLRNLDDNRQMLIELMSNVQSAVEKSSKDPNTVEFVQTQVNSVVAEYHREQPNQTIVSAAVGATLVLAERLDDDVVDAGLVDKLASFAPSAFRRL